ncbi:hypothetical protein BOTBODRAFT_34306 [Botryobasidium botryosum FD-172 SS1]|uniref:Citrate transporter-like domain-containing protein n=1 Tax=Botryobasidium botryosum (strain FD-172 SS1) TaxID=930990 RepID=A0A067MCY6_BOTB1|nr:hypothetical protein BOTBODRAFT_34306 [Botryobasidium botryosum FD-172 SS1]
MISGSAIATLVLFIISIFFVIVPVSIPLRRFGFPLNLPINLSTAPIIAIAVLWAAQCIGATQIRDGIVGTDGIKPYNILILFMSLAYMAITLDVTGILQAAAFWVSNRGGSNGWKLYFYFYVMLTLLSVILGNDPIILSGTVFLVYYTQALGLDPLAWLIAEFAAANTASMVLFVGNPTNVVICEGFRINNVAFSAYTIFPFLACNVLCFGALAFQFRSQKYIPRRLDRKGDLDPKSVLKDPVSARVGGILLGSCLAVALVVSFFNVDVWKIMLPFAVAKFIFDITWDHWRYSRGIIGHRDEKGAVEEGSDEEEIVRQMERVGTMKSPHLSSPRNRQSTLPTTSSESELPPTLVNSAVLPTSNKDTLSKESSSPTTPTKPTPLASQRSKLHALHLHLTHHFPTFFKALPRLPFALVPFAFSQFILIESLAHQGWIEIFAGWLVRAGHRAIYPTVWLIGILGVVLCNLAGTNIGATIFLTKIMRAAALPPDTARAGAIALAVASNIGAVSFTFSASLAGLLWRGILEQKGITIRQREFALWNMLPILVMTVVGLAIVCAEMAVLY